MKIFTRDYRITGEYNEVLGRYFDGLKPCVLDIETTGLSPSRCKVVLVGLLMRTERGVTITQFLAENHYEEFKVLEATMDYLEENDAGYLITFNGCAFDVPFLNSRLDANMAGRSISMYHFDLYRYLQKCTDLKSRIGSMGQKAIENYYGILSDRGDTITGRESVMLFDQYALTGNTTAEKIILTHNREDVQNLNRLMYMAPAEAHDMHEAIARYGFPAARGRLSVRPRIQKNKSRLLITGEQFRDPVSCAFFPDADCPVTASANSLSGSYEITVPLSCHSGDYFLDISVLFSRSDFSINGTKIAAGFDALRSDPDCVNGYLILNSRTINLLSGLLAEYYIR